MAQRSGDTRRMSPLKSVLILLLAIGGVAAFGIWFLAYLAPGVDTEMSAAGSTAMVVGVLFSVVVGGGLMALVFFSSRRGYDDDLARRQDK